MQGFSGVGVEFLILGDLCRGTDASQRVADIVCQHRDELLLRSLLLGADQCLLAARELFRHVVDGQ